MSNIEVELAYYGPVKSATGIEKEKVSLEEGKCLSDLLSVLATKYGTKFRSLIFGGQSEEDCLSLREGLIVLLNGETCDFTSKLSNGDNVIFLTAISGG